MKTYDSYEQAAEEARQKGKPIWRHNSGYYAVATYEEIAAHCAESGEEEDWVEIS
jgi:endonuclease YncB( thermonuclease family)